MHFIEFIQSHPRIALFVGLTHIIAAETIHKIEVPVVIMQVFQLTAWTVTSVVGLITITGWLKKTKFLKHGKEKNDKTKEG